MNVKLLLGEGSCSRVCNWSGTFLVVC